VDGWQNYQNPRQQNRILTLRRHQIEPFWPLREANRSPNLRYEEQIVIASTQNSVEPNINHINGIVKGLRKIFANFLNFDVLSSAGQSKPAIVRVETPGKSRRYSKKICEFRGSQRFCVIFVYVLRADSANGRSRKSGVKSRQQYNS
jgi:hypothetical protein